jgi:Family of unknown function (DUF6714)
VNVTDSEALKAQIRKAFADVDYPGDWCLRRSDEGIEPYSLEEEFRGKRDKEALDAEFVDMAPDGLSSALSFFSDEAFRFYLPAYLIADIDGKLQRVDPIFFLLHGLDESTSKERVNPARYGDRTWFDVARYKFAMFTRDQARAIFAYLRFGWQKEVCPESRKEISEALRNYWLERAAEDALDERTAM